jgi:hypothetical protein
MLSEERKLLISSYIDGEATPSEAALVRKLLETSKFARDYFQGQLWVARRVRQTLYSDPPTKGFDTTDVMREIFSRSQVSPVASTTSYRRRPLWGAIAIAAGLILWVGLGAIYPTHFEVGGNWKDQEIASVSIPELQLESKVEPLLNLNSDSKMPSNPLPYTNLAIGSSPRVSESLKQLDNDSEQSLSKGQGPLTEGDLAPSPSGILAFPVGASQTLKRIDLVLPSVFKAKSLDPDLLSDRELNGILRLDLPTFQENEATKRLMATLKAEGCATFLDPLVEEKIRRNTPVGPIVIVVQGLDSTRVCRVIQGTSKTGNAKTPPNQPNSVFDEVIVGNLSARELEAIPGILAPNSLRTRPFRKANETENTQKLSKSNSQLGAFATIASASALRIPGVVNSRKVGGETAFDSAKAPVVLNIVPLR